MAKQMKPLKLTQDLVFKAFFSRNERTLRALLNAFLPTSDPILEIDILNRESEDEKNADASKDDPPSTEADQADATEVKPTDMLILADHTIIADTPDQKQIILDLRVKLDSGENVNIEMQATSQEKFLKRVLFYWAKFHSDNLQRGDDFDQAKPTYSLIFTTFSVLDKSLKKSITNFFMYAENESKARYNEDLNITIVELNKIPKDHNKLLDLREKWCYFLYYSTTLSEEARKNLSQHEELKMAIRHLDQLKKDKQLHQRALDREMSMVASRLDRQGLLEKGMAKGMEKGKTEGIEKGKAEGMAKGIEKERLAIANRLLKKGYTLPEILEITGLSATDLSQLK